MTKPREGAEPPKVDGPIAVEYVPLELLGMNPDEPVATELMTLCAGIVRAFAPTPDGVRLVITGDFVSSVRARSVTEHQQQNYAVARNAGEVGGKTMSLPNGTIDVLLPAYLFLPDMDEEILASRRVIATRTVTHEAFHVAMNQADETVTDYTSEPFVRGNLLYIADAVMEEYRAEVSLADNLRTAPEGAWEPLEIVTHLRDALRRIACVEYQAHLDVGRLCTDIGVECLHAWQLLAYIAAAQTQSDGRVAALPGTVTSDPLWACNWSGCGGVPGVFAREAVEHGEHGDGVLGCGGGVGADGGEVLGAVEGAHASGDFLSDLGHSDLSFGRVVVERYGRVGGEA